MKKRFLLAVSLLALVCSCEQTSEAPKQNNTEQKKSCSKSCETEKPKEAAQPESVAPQQVQVLVKPEASVVPQETQTVSTPEVKVEKAQ